MIRCMCKEAVKLGERALVRRAEYNPTRLRYYFERALQMELKLAAYCPYCYRILEFPEGVWHVTWPNGTVVSETEGLKTAIACVEPGWRWLIGRLWRDIREMGWDGNLYQVKEKFGGLRFYIGSATDEIHNRIHRAENESEEICELCGRPGKLRSGGWIKTLCDEHAGDRPAHRWMNVDCLKKVK